jgi:predicted metal-dependent phosphoesterase TrpH
MALCELHCHSQASDGSLSPGELIHHAADAGISALCLTDHDTVAGLEEASRAAELRGIRFIPGIEIEISHPSGAFHLLGLGIYDYQGHMEDILPRVRQDRIDRNMAIAKKMARLGVPGEYRDVAALADGDVVGRPHFAEYLIRKGFAFDVADAFERFLGPGGSLYVPREGIDLEEAIGKIHQSGGVAVVAHPASLHLSWTKLRKEAAEWKEMGLDGIEAYHASVKLNDGKKYHRIAEELELLATAGSDFHTPEQRHKVIGHRCIEQLEIGEEFLRGIVA